jgi:hypothetical protein
MATTPKNLTNARVEHANLLIAGISVTGSALSSLANAEIAGHAVKSDTVTSVSKDLETMVSKLRDILVPV